MADGFLVGFGLFGGGMRMNSLGSAGGVSDWSVSFNGSPFFTDLLGVLFVCRCGSGRRCEVRFGALDEAVGLRFKRVTVG